MEVMDALLVENRKDLVTAINNVTALVQQGHALWIILMAVTF